MGSIRTLYAWGRGSRVEGEDPVLLHMGKGWWRFLLSGLGKRNGSPDRPLLGAALMRGAGSPHGKI